MSKLISYIKPEEFNAILKAEKKKEFKLAYLFAFGSGLRISEIIGYKRKAKIKVIEDNPEVHGDMVIGQPEIKPLSKEQIDLQAKTIHVIGGKNNKSRIVPLFPGFKEEYIKMLPLQIKRSTLQSRFSRIALKATGKKFHFHQLRHGFAVASIKQGVKLPFLQMALGHSRLDTTGIYTQSDPQDMLEDYRKAWDI